jgi:hypothetical protein
MWKLLSKLCGWDYIAWKNTASQGIARVYLDGDGVCYYWRYKNIKVADRINSADQVVWLTCSSEKYLRASLMEGHQ